MKLVHKKARDAWKPSKWRAAAQSKFNQLIRIKAADINGMCTCITCGKRARWDAAKNLGMDGMDSGHWRPGQSVSFIEINCHPQCVRCNQHMSGNIVEYNRYMLRTYGQHAMDFITRLSKQPANNSKDWLRLMEHQFQMAIEHEWSKLR